MKNILYCLVCKKELNKSKSGLCLSCVKLGINNLMWKGDRVGYSALHAWVNRNLIRPQVCRDCNQPKKLELANISQKYKRDMSDWEWLCRKCHMAKDGRGLRLGLAGSKYNKNLAKTRKRDKLERFV